MSVGAERLRTGALTAAALVCFAANSWLCRAALRSGAIDAVSFTTIRIGSGAAVLGMLALYRSARVPGAAPLGGSWPSALALFGYAIAFSLAYLSLEAGMGTLLAFGAVQLTMLLASFRQSGRPRAAELGGLVLNLSGLALLGLPGAQAPPVAAALSMLVAGVAWGLYSLRGRREPSPPIAANAGNFLRAAPLALVASGIAALAVRPEVTARGVILALVSGAVTSGLGYAIWYVALPRLRATFAGLVQGAVPILAALGGTLLFDERITVRLVVSGALVLTGIALPLLTGREPGGR